jgi:hypothetical protein
MLFAYSLRALAERGPAKQNKINDMNNNSNAVMGWVLGIIIVALVILAAWWYVANNNTAGVPNTGTQQTQTNTGTGSMNY